MAGSDTTTAIWRVAASVLCAAAGTVVLASQARYAWTEEVKTAAFPGSYNFPVYTVRNELWALHPEGAWTSRDAKSWTRTPLPPSGLNLGYQDYVRLGDAVYALGTMTGNYLDLHLTSRISRTTGAST